MTPFAILIGMALCAEESSHPFAEEKVRYELRPTRLDAEDLFGPNARSGGVPFLVDSGERCHDGLLATLEKLEQKKIRSYPKAVMSNLFEVLTGQKCDRSRFVPVAVKYALTPRNQINIPEGVRQNAIKLLGEIGKAEHVEKLIPLLQDEEKPIRQESLTAIRNLGDQRHAKLVLDQLGAPRPKLPPLTKAEQEEMIEVYKHLNTVPDPTTPKK